METLGQRIKRRREELGLDQLELAKLVGFSQPTLANLESGKNSRTKFLPEIARALRTTVEALSGGNNDLPSTDDSSLIAGARAVQVLGDEETHSEALQIRRVKLKLSAGISGFAVEPDLADDNPIWFRKTWLESRGYRNEHLIALRVKGQSMEPGLFEGDTVVVNTLDTKPRDGSVFAVNYEGEAVIKRLVREIGFWWLVSDNPDQRRYPRKRCEGESCLIIGRIIHKQSEQI